MTEIEILEEHIKKNNLQPMKVKYNLNICDCKLRQRLNEILNKLKNGIRK